MKWGAFVLNLVYFCPQGQQDHGFWSKKSLFGTIILAYKVHYLPLLSENLLILGVSSLVINFLAPPFARSRKMHLRLFENDASEAQFDLDALSGPTEVSLEIEERSEEKYIANSDWSSCGCEDNWQLNRSKSPKASIRYPSICWCWWRMACWCFKDICPFFLFFFKTYLFTQVFLFSFQRYSCASIIHTICISSNLDWLIP